MLTSCAIMKSTYLRSVQMFCMILMLAHWQSSHTSLAEELPNELNHNEPQPAYTDCLDCYQSQSTNQSQVNLRINEAPNHSYRNNAATESISPKENTQPFNSTSTRINETDPYSRTIYSSLLKILYHMKQQLDKSNQLKEREDDYLSTSNSLPLLKGVNMANGEPAPDADATSNIGSTSSSTGDLSGSNEIGENLTNDQMLYSANSRGSFNGGISARSHETNFKDTGQFSAPSTDTQSGPFKPIVTLEVSGEPLIQPQSTAGLITGSIATSAKNLDDGLVKSKRTTFSNQLSSDRSISNRLNKKLSLAAEAANLQNAQQQLSSFFPRNIETLPTKSWSLTDKFGQLLPDEQPEKSSFSYSNPDNAGNSFNPNHDFYEPSVSNSAVISQTMEAQKKMQRERPSTNTQLESEENYETQPIQTTSRPKPRSRRSKLSPRPMALLPALIAPEKISSAKYLRITDQNSNRDLSFDPDDDGSRPVKVSNYVHDNSENTPRQDHSNVHLQQVYPASMNQHAQFQHLPQQRVQQQQQQAVYTLAAAPPGMNFKSFATSLANSAQTSSSGPSPIHDTPPNLNHPSNQQRDLTNQPQTIQITAVPNVGLNNQLVRLNGMNGLNGLNGNLGLNNLVYGQNGFMDPYGRQVVMLNAERRQVDWSFWFWPVLLAVTLPVVLGALFVPVFLKTIVMLIQVLQSLGLLMPITNALTQQIVKASGISIPNQLDQSKI